MRSRLSDRNSWGAAIAWIGVDSTVAYGLVTRIWQAVAGVFSLLLISHYFAQDIQGYYYTFFSLLALQSFFELGLYLVVINTASHEWAHLKLAADGRVEGQDRHLLRLASLARFIFAWYLAAALLLMVVVGAGGFWFFSNQSGSGEVKWLMPWMAVVLLFSLSVLTSPFVTLLEGCNQVLEVNRARFWQAISGALLLWVAIAGGAGLWASLVSPATNLIFSLFLLAGKYRNFLLPLLRRKPDAGIDWRSEIWPLQWKLAAQGITNYFLYSLFTPVMFQYHGPIVAGQMGMTIQVVYAVQVMAQAWLQAKTPVFGIHAAQRNYLELDRIWWETTLRSLGFVVVGETALWLLVLVLEINHVPFSERILRHQLVAILAATMVISQYIQCVAAYVRAHKKEPFVAVGVCSGLLSGVLVWWWGSGAGPAGAAWGTLVVTALFAAPLVTLIWRSRQYR